ncbi:hypothetical protein HK097_005584 [Rhizophlyctis rosea]|uniref:C2H2-type domain-containing protein n=1 Tax=Rhizophlyctis rosea TaxID=64517 RepID=A0AAD5SEW5_9FUNG|nr:hypothetical protein HK097_005584 [Rhizophlyctis rosea]
MPSTTHEVMPPLQSSLPPLVEDFTLFENHADMTPHDDAAALFGPSLPAQCDNLIVGATVGNDGRTEQCERNALLLIPTLGDGGDGDTSVEGLSPEGAEVPCDDPMEDWAGFERPMFGGETELAERFFSSRGEQGGVAGHLCVACGDKILTGGAFVIDNKDSTTVMVDQQQQQSDDLFEELLNCENTGAPLSPMEGLSASLPELAQSDSFFAAIDEIVASPSTPANLTATEDLNQLISFSTDFDDLWSGLCDPSQIDSSPVPALSSPTESNVSTDFSPFLSPISISTSDFPTSPVDSLFFPPSPSPSEEITIHVEKSKDATVDDIDRLEKHADGNYYCPHPECERPFERRYNLKTHYAAKHADMKDYPCGVCCRSFARKYDMVRHMKTKHNVTGHVVVGGRVSKPGKPRAGKAKALARSPLFPGR